MRIRPRVALVVATAVVVAAPVAAAAPQPARGGADARAVTRLLQRQARLFNAGRWQALWQPNAPRFRRGCSYRLWLREQQAARRAIGAPIAVRGIKVRVARRRASVTYTLLLGDLGASVVRRSRPDLYVKKIG